ncbi:putative RNA methyltransferase domain-containing protein [Ditylenchus destructor]|uniref:RNA methyltransferase domain-containing protein n=1 Tax=Ditylenchus destructor TaxID=166010 RepID=A0AAD4NGV1_9BILA|nr:putative RNA methyltransferase domain-containing protein [Ditylenchus destructor]
MSFPYNRKDRLQIAQKTKSKIKKVNWNARKIEKRAQRDKEFLESVENSAYHNDNKQNVWNEQPKLGNQSKWYNLSVALPGSILNNAQCAELQTYLAGEIARTCAVFCVDEVVVFDETAKMTERQVDAYYSGSWANSAQNPLDSNIEGNFYLAKILEYLECPQYLRKSLFPLQRPLKYAGLLNPLDAMHHLRAHDLQIPYREGVVLHRPMNKGHGPLCDVGLDRELQLPPHLTLPPGTRVTLKILDSENPKKLKGEVTSPSVIRKESGIYWGYKVRIAKSLSEVVCNSKYDVIIGTSERGTPLNQLNIEFKENCNILIVFGGLGGLEIAVDADEGISETDPAACFTNYVNSLDDQGSRIIRTEEAIPITLAALKYKLNELG